MISHSLKYALYGFVFCVLLFFYFGAVLAQEEEKSYSISLTKTAEKQEGMEILELDDKKVLAQEHTVQQGDYLWKLFRERGLLAKQNLSELLSTLKKLNKSLHNLDLIHPGQKIIIPLKIAPIVEGPVIEETVPVAEVKDLDFQNYTVQRNDSLIRIIKGMYRIPQDALYNDYLKLVRKMNPDMKNLNTIYPGQNIRLPIYSPEVIRVPIQTASKTTSGDMKKVEKKNLEPNPLADDLADIFMEMGEEWVRSGEHFIPLKTGGQLNLKASAFPIINLKKGLRVIVDLDSNLPPKMAGLIESSWKNYSVVRLTRDESLSVSLGHILNACNFHNVLKEGEPFETGKDIRFRITGDWIVELDETGNDNPFNAVVINLRDGNMSGTPLTIRNYLKGLGVKIIDYPPDLNSSSVETAEIVPLHAAGESVAPIKAVLDFVGQSYSVDTEIPVYQSRAEDIKLVIRADFSLEVNGKDAVIDVTGLAPEVISLLEEQGFMALPLAKEKEPLNLIARTCEFLGVQFHRGPHHFMINEKQGSKSIRLTLSGVVFPNSSGESILATTQKLPDEIRAFLSQRGYKILFVSL